MDTPAAAPDFLTLRQRIDELAPLIEREADAAEAARHMTTPVYTALLESGLWHMRTPRALGGAELNWSESLELAEAVARIDGSTGWCLMVAGVQHGSCGSLISDEGCAAVFAEGTSTNIAGQGIPRGIAHSVDGGYMIRGSWSYGSGIYHANWIHSGCVLMDGDAPVTDAHGHPVVLITYVPREDIVLGDNWDVLGLRGTGSYDYALNEEIFVPAERAYVYSKNTVERGGHAYALGIVGFTAWGHTAFALGVGRHALDEVATIAREKAGPFGILADSPSFQEKYARAEARYRATRALVYETWGDLDATLAAGGQPTVEQIALIKLAFRHAHEVMSDVCTFAYNGGGGVALRKSTLQRCYRDLHAGLQHVLLADQIMADCGKVLMGHAPADAEFQLLGLQ